MASTQKTTIGIMGAMPQEIDGVASLLENCSKKTLGGRTFICGNLNGIATVVVFSRWGKVAAAATVSALILEFAVTGIIFTGVAGAIAPELKIGDIVIAKRLIQHDMDARPLMPQFEIPLLHKTYFETDASGFERISRAVKVSLENKNLYSGIGTGSLEKFGITDAKLYVGDIASGDTFFSSEGQKNRLIQALPDILCVEMEGAAVAQVCYEYGIPFNVVRIISDVASENSHIDFAAFIREIASRCSTAIIQETYKLL